MAESGCYSWEGDDLLLQVRVQPRASRDELAEMRDGYWRVRLTAPPVEGKANAHLCKFLAAVFQVPGSRVVLVSGAANRNKRLRIHAPRRLPPGIKPPAGAVELPEQ
jgi:uncharacterized protein (TIGR00251 family)